MQPLENTILLDRHLTNSRFLREKIIYYNRLFT